MNAHNKSLGKILRRTRKAKRLSQGEVAAVIGVTVSAVSQFETGKIGLSGVTLLKIARLLDIDLARPGLVQPLEKALPEQETREGEDWTAVDPSRVSELRDEIETAYDLMTALDKTGDGIGGDVGHGVSAVALAARAALDNARSMLNAMEASRGSRATGAPGATRVCACEDGAGHPETRRSSDFAQEVA